MNIRKLLERGSATTRYQNRWESRGLANYIIPHHFVSVVCTRLAYPFLPHPLFVATLCVMHWCVGSFPWEPSPYINIYTIGQSSPLPLLLLRHPHTAKPTIPRPHIPDFHPTFSVSIASPPLAHSGPRGITTQSDIWGLSRRRRGMSAVRVVARWMPDSRPVGELWRT